MLQRHLSRAFFAFGGLVNDHAAFFIIFSLGVTIVLSPSLLILALSKPVHSLTIFTPENGPSTAERSRIERLWPYDVDDYYPLKNYQPKLIVDSVVGVRDSSRSNLLTMHGQLLQILRQIDKISIVDERTGIIHRYNDLCLKYKGMCFDNTMTVQLLKQHSRDGNLYNIGYPYAQAGEPEVPFYIGNVFGGVTLGKDGSAEAIEAMRWGFFLRDETQQVEELSRRWLLELQSLFEQLNVEDSELEFGVFSRMTLVDVTEQIAAKTSKFIPLAVLCVSVYAVLTTLSFVKFSAPQKPTCTELLSSLTFDWRRSKCIYGVLGVVIAGMSLSSALGLLLVTELMEYSAILVVVPFLVLGIAMDDMFIVLTAFEHYETQADIRSRLQHTMSEAAASITVTTLTNVLSFAIGSLSSFPAIRIFCVNTALSLTFALFYQVTFFTGFLAVGGAREADGKHHLWPRCVLDPAKSKDRGFACYYFASGSAAFSTSRSSANNEVYRTLNIASRPIRSYAEMLLSPIGRTSSFLLYLVYVVVAVYGTVNMPIGLNPPKLVDAGHPAQRWYQLNERYFWREGERVDIFITEPPDLSNRFDREEFAKFLNALESTRFTLDSRWSQCWIRDYMTSNPNKDFNSRVTWNEDLCHWINSAAYQSVWLSLVQTEAIVWKGGNCTSGIMQGFRVSVGLRDFTTAHGQSQAATTIRDICSRSRFGAVSYHFLWEFMDQYTIVAPNTIQTAGIAFGAMLLVALLFLPNHACAVLVGAAIASVTLGVTGSFYYWDISLDFVSMVQITLAVGFAVDLSAHVAIAFSAAQGTPSVRAINALCEVGVPVTQGAISTLLAVIVLGAGSKDYIVLVFFKATVGVVLSGIVHALVFLPVFMATASTVTAFVRMRLRTIKVT